LSTLVELLVVLVELLVVLVELALAAGAETTCDVVAGIMLAMMCS
jgi:hypothetical protein